MEPGVVQGPRQEAWWPRAHFDVTAPVIGDDGWEVTAIMDLTDPQRGEAIDGKRVQFYRDGEPYERPVETGSDGRAQLLVKGLGFGKHLIEAKMVSLPDVHRSKVVDIRPAVSLDLSESVPGDEGAEVTATAYVSVDGRSVAGERIEFSLDERSSGTLETTDRDGRAKRKFERLGRGRHTIGAKIDKLVTRDRKTFEVKEEQAEAPVELSVDAFGGDGRYELVITVLSPKGLGMPRRAVRIQADRESATNQTGEDGVYRHPFRFDDFERFVTVSVVGTKLSKTLRLFGPRR